MSLFQRRLAGCMGVGLFHIYFAALAGGGAADVEAGGGWTGCAQAVDGVVFRGAGFIERDVGDARNVVFG